MMSESKTILSHIKVAEQKINGILSRFLFRFIDVDKRNVTTPKLNGQKT